MKRRRLVLPIVLGAVALIVVVAFLLGRPADDHVFFETLRNDRPLVIAHRGGALLWPENTLVAFDGAVELGSDVLEMDIFRTADGVPVVIHDPTVDRTTDGTGLVSSFTLERLKRLDAGYRFIPAGAVTNPYRGEGVTIPTLREVFEAFPDEHMIVEIKENDTEAADAVVELVREFNRTEHTLLGSFHHDVLVRVRSVAPEIATHGSEKELTTLLVMAWLLLDRAYSPAYEAVLVPQRSGPIPVTTRRFISAARRRNLFVAPWTINDPDDMKMLIGRGADGLITDRPDLALEIVREE
ncbi:MAG: glycerophosphodiester phosphodiesterase [Spirochaetaceae bacterium]|nr:MAG: glycerophosphodiester phosphodiesterase [Spirochaetaceae bacterium]